MAADRLLKSKLNPEVAAERKRCAGCVALLIDAVLDLHQTCAESEQFAVGLFAADLAHLAAVVRDGGDEIELERRLRDRVVAR